MNEKRISEEEWMHIHGKPMTREEVLYRLRDYPVEYEQFLKFPIEFREEFLAFSTGIKGAKMTYDSFFKHIFNPEARRNTVEKFLSACLGEEVEILAVLQNESDRITEESSLLIADMLVRLKSGALVNVEIQRIGYYFPGERCACYSSDLVMRQYSYLKSKRKEEHKTFSYCDIKKVYTIVIIQESTHEFKQHPNDYLHYARQTFNTGLQLDLLQEYLLIPLDIFLKIQHNKISKLDAWLYFIASDDLADIRRICSLYPEFMELYREVFRFRFHPKELMSMFSEALKILDQGTVQYMIDDMEKKLEEKDAVIEKKDAVIEEKDAMIARLTAEITALKQEK